MNRTNPSIRILPEEIASKIAAGEVIQRPASVVKEAVENSIDAGSSRIVVTIKESGRSLVQISDDGSGIRSDDLRVAFERHATSKISSYDDLEKIHTLGFRGEALASIAAVAQVELRTRTSGESVGVRLKIDGGIRQPAEPHAMEPGTVVAVRNLFFNTPARRNFLKTDATEFRHILETLQRAALSRPDISFSFISDDETIFDLMPGTIRERIGALFGEDLGEGLMECDEQTDYMSVSGFLAKPEYSRRSRNDQFLFLNRRFIVNRSVNHAVYRAYEHLMIKGNYPFYVLYLDIDPRRIDVNVHPSKLEAKFDDERSVYGIVTAVARKTLARYDMVPSFDMISGGEGTGFMRPDSARDMQTLHMLRVDPATGEIVEETTRTDSIGTNPFFSQREFTGGSQPAALKTDIETGGDERSRVADTGWIYQLHNKYIFAQIRSGVMVIDQHVAHERILYEKALKRFAESGPSSQQLLFPETIDLDRADAMLVKEMMPLLGKLGFDIKLFGGNTVVLEGIPSDVRPGSEHNILRKVLEEFRTHSDAQLDVRDNLAKSFACKAAIKSGDPLNETEMRTLIDQLFATTMPYVCPHGRPVVIKLTVDELDRKFGRT